MHDEKKGVFSAVLGEALIFLAVLVAAGFFYRVGYATVDLPFKKVDYNITVGYSIVPGDEPMVIFRNNLTFIFKQRPTHEQIIAAYTGHDRSRIKETLYPHDSYRHFGFFHANPMFGFVGVEFDKLGCWVVFSAYLLYGIMRLFKTLTKPLRALMTASLFFLLPFLANQAALADEIIERGSPNYVLDSTANALSIPQKVILLNPRIENHSIGSETEDYLREFLEDNPELADVKIRMNQCDPIGEMHRLQKNSRVSWWWRIFPGIPTTLWSSLTGRLLGGDNYNPFTNTISLYSDSPSVALHEAGHAKDFAQKFPGLDTDVYALGRILPPVALYQEYYASREAINYFKEKGDEKQEINSYGTLCPAFGTYGGAYSGAPYGNILGAAIGHGVAFFKKDELKFSHNYVRMGAVCEGFENDALGKNLVESQEDKEAALRSNLTSSSISLNLISNSPEVRPVNAKEQ